MRCRLELILVVFLLLGGCTHAWAGSAVIERWKTFGKSDGLPSEKVFAVLSTDLGCGSEPRRG